MTREAERMRTALLAVLDKFFSQADLPEYLRALKDIAHASALVHAACFAYHTGEFRSGQRDLAKAVKLDPTLRDHNYKKLVQMLVGWSHDPRSAGPAGFLQRIILNPPVGQPGLGRPLRRAMADALLEPLFAGSRQARRAQRWELLQVIRYKPDWLLNRGVLRILADAWLAL
jgi:hypothetical protein